MQTRSKNGRSSRKAQELLLPLTMQGDDNVTPTKRPSTTRRVLSAARKPLQRLVAGRGRRDSNDAQPQEASIYGSISASDGDAPAQQRRQQRSSVCSEAGLSTVSSVGGSHRSLQSSESQRQHLGQTENGNVRSLEGILRQSLFILLAYMIGVWRPDWSGVISRIAEYTAVAWVTCMVVLFMPYFRPPSTSGVEKEETKTLLQEPPQQDRSLDLIEEQLFEDSPSEEVVVEHSTVTRPSSGRGVECPHPSLEPYYVINVENNERIFPNVMQPTFKVSNHYFDGYIMLLIRTPDVDDSSVSRTATNESAAAYFSGKQRRFEFQFQVKLKKVPEGQVFFACELEEPIKMGLIQRAFVSAAMAFMKKMNPTFHYSIAGQPPTADGMFEKPHMAFTVEGSMDRLIVTPPGQEPPKLGGVLVEDAESLKWRKKGGNVEWNTRDTYTFALWSAYVDFLDWRCLNLPGIRPFPLDSVIGHQHISLMLYVAPATAERHNRAEIDMISGVEMSNVNSSHLGPLAKKWIANEPGEIPKASRKLSFDEENLECIDEDMFDEVDDVETAAELGEGLYVTSGDSYVIQESPSGNIVANGGGFCILQERAVASVVSIEKFTRTRRGKQTTHSDGSSSELIRSGDTVILKLVTSPTAGVKYLSLHRRWWLKWVSDEPTRNGHFTIHAEEEDDQSGSFLTVGAPFLLRHKRWDGYEVGVSLEESPTYGGLMLGLFNGDANNADLNQNPDDEEGENLEIDLQGATEKLKNQWMRPLLLAATPSASSRSPSIHASQSVGSDTEDPVVTFDAAPAIQLGTNIANESLFFKPDVPVWIELMNRLARRRQLAYAVRVSVESPPDMEEKDDDVSGREYNAFVRLRTGRDLAAIMRSGIMEPERMTPEPSRLRQKKAVTQVPGTPRSNSGDLQSDSGGGHANDDFAISPQPSLEEDYASEEWEGGEIVEHDGDYTSGDEADLEPSSHSDRKRGRKIIGQIAKSVKTGTVSTGKKVVKSSKKATKAIVAPMQRSRPKRPPAKEPKTIKSKTTGRAQRRVKERDHHKLVNRTMKRIGRRTKGTFLASPPTVLAGHLSGPDQSCRTASHVLARIPTNSQGYEELVVPQMSQSDLDKGFLRGGAAQLGVVPFEKNVVRGFVVARCLWESHWREEWCGICEDKLVLYPSLAKKASLVLFLNEIRGVRSLNTMMEYNPLPGYPLVAIDTASHVYYIALVDEKSQQLFSEEVDRLLSSSVVKENSVQENLLWKARFWQGFREAAEASQSEGKRKWAKIPSGATMKHRTILNNRKMSFDADTLTNDGIADAADAAAFSAKLLSRALAVTPASLENSPEEFIELLDMTCQLRSIPLESFDLQGLDAYCFFINIYHCLLQHSLLVTVNGPLNKKSAGHYMRTTCYEIGGDVFSLAELNYCVIRGNSGKPFSPKPPYLDIPRKSSGYRLYALGYANPKTNFAMHTGDLSCPQSVQVFHPNTVLEQLDELARRFMNGRIVVDGAKNSVILPKICDVFRADFGTTDSAVLRYCLLFADEEVQQSIQNMMKEDHISIKYNPCAELYYQHLKLSGTELRPRVAEKLLDEDGLPESDISFPEL